jgi:hypothetical protein
MKVLSFVAVTLLAVSLTGCSGDAGAGGPSAVSSSDEYMLATEPAGAVAVAKVKANGKTGDEVVLVGKIAGSTKPFIDDLAAFTLIDLAVPHCAPEEGCPTPWDCCCHLDEAQAKQALVQVVDTQGDVVATDARKLLGVKELDEVVVQGKIERDAQGNLIVLANKVFIR